MFTRAIVIVLDSVGVGELPDAAAYGDQGSNTLGNIGRLVALNIPTLAALGLVADRAACRRAAARSAARRVRPHGRAVGGQGLGDRALGADGHRARPRVPDLPGRLSGMTSSPGSRSRIGRPVLGNVVASGTAIIDELGAEHVRTGRPIVYTSADSVFQIAAHEEVVPIAQLYEWCEIAYELTVTGLGLGRVIARPFVGEPGAFKRTANRHDYAMPPRGETLLDRLTAAGVPTIAIGKISDLFAGRGISERHFDGERR